MTEKEKIENLKKDLHLARLMINELKQSKKDIKKFYQAQIISLQDKIKELLSNAPN
jgi:hypothetical protein